ncbi:integrase core domain-containing protein [Corynebacterium phocae]|uniref:integrase core domain-containing protein n=1 Tax=Corynebacterium phocae TaxID=161895 RepID=UPI00123965E8|nr:integrase core domain-containing protein [Corynebacterium phocae]KAA8727409.1 transposase family protein [Corynebacterium phocae]
MSIWFAGIESGELQPPVPSVSTIARLLRHAGGVESNPRKRPKSSYLRFQRGKAMELWQLDGLKYHLYDQQSTVITIYQLIDDATRKDMGTSAYPSNENSADALDVVTRAIAHYGAPNELLTDNASAFNQLRQGKVGPLEEYVASQGCKPIPGRPGHPQTQGKNERSHTTLIRFLDAHRPTTLEQAKELITTYREHYNTRRPHQGLGKPVMTPEQAWELMEHAEPQPPLDSSYLAAVAAKYRRQRQQAVTTDPIVNTGEKPAPNKGQKYRRAKQAELDQVTNADDGDDTGEDLPYAVEITHQNRAVFFRGRRISVPTKYSGKFYIRNVTEDELTY